MGQEGLLDDLRKELAAGNVLVVVGTGVSIQASGGDKRASWDGLILDGIDYAAGHDLLADDKANALRANLKSDRLKVAEELSKVVVKGDLRHWLRDSVGKLPLVDATIIDSVHAIEAPLATTNYDDLLSRGRNFEAVPWNDVAAALELLHGNRQGVLHFHGYYREPDSVVLGVESYQDLLASGHAQAIQKAVAAMRTLLFVGCGDGLTDPNFGALLQWSADLSDAAGYPHYALVRKGEARPKAPHVKFIEYGEKYEDLASFIRDEIAAARSPERATTLPNAGFCVGREDEVNDLVAALLEGSPVPILGGPGMGKTTIGLEALNDERVAARFGALRYFVRLDGAKTRAEVVAAIGLTIGIPISPNVERDVVDALAAAPAALVLDNAETPLDGDQEQVEELLARLSSIDPLSLVATIRGNERPHSVTWTKSVRANELTGDEAAEAFVRWSGKPAFRNDPYLPKLLAALDGVPLAITLMARYAELFDSLEIVSQRWSEKRTSMLKDRTPGVGRLHDIAVSYELSIGVLSDSARRLLSVLALLPDGAAREDLSGIFPEPDDAADELRRRALIVDEALRVRMRAPLREYIAAARPPEATDEERTIRHYRTLAAREGGKVGAVGGAGAVARLAPEVANIETVFVRKREAKLEVLKPAVNGWGVFMRFTGLGSIAPIKEVMNAASVVGTTELIAQCALSLGGVALSRSDHEAAKRWYEDALTLYREAGNTTSEANCIKSLGDLALRQWDYERATERYEEALLLCRREAFRLGEANCIRGLGDIAFRRGDDAGARERYEEALPLYRKVEGVLGEANCIGSLADLALSRSDYEGARERYEEALPLFRRVGSPLGEANCIKGLGDVALQRLDSEGARERYEEALPLYRRVGNVLGEANCIRSFGDIALVAGDVGKALSCYRAALSLLARISEVYSIGGTYQRIARVTEGAERAAHVAAARTAWTSIGRDDLLAQLDEEFGAA